MSEQGDFESDRALAARWRAALVRATPARPDFADLAAFLDNTLAAGERARVEAALAAHPDLIGLVAAPAPLAADTPIPLSIVQRAQALVPAAAPTARVWPARRALAWSGIAACLLILSVTGFQLGSLTGEALDAGATSSDLMEQSGGSLG